jgi:hypothetical protein
MPTGAEQLHEPPPYLAGKIPSVKAFAAALGNAVKTLPVDTVYFRAAWNEKYILPDTLKRAYRFGPPRTLHHEDGTLPFAWLYVALDMKTAIWESQFAKSDATAAGEFYLDPAAVAQGVVAKFRLRRGLRVWDLTGDACSKLGVYDTISSADHEACHWIGYRLRQAMIRREPKAMPDGFLYPSRRMRGRTAIALRSELLAELQAIATVTSEPFQRCASMRYWSVIPCARPPRIRRAPFELVHGAVPLHDRPGSGPTSAFTGKPADPTCSPHEI